MTIKLSNDTLLFIQADIDKEMAPEGGHFCLVLNREGKELELTYRFRYYESDKIENSGDRFSWYGGKFDMPEKEAMDRCTTLGHQMPFVSNMRIIRRDEYPDTDSFMAEVMNHPSMHKTGSYKTGGTH